MHDEGTDQAHHFLHRRVRVIQDLSTQGGQKVFTRLTTPERKFPLIGFIHLRLPRKHLLTTGAKGQFPPGFAPNLVACLRLEIRHTELPEKNVHSSALDWFACLSPPP
jgi:hypothetical protein